MWPFDMFHWPAVFGEVVKQSVNKFMFDQCYTTLLCYCISSLPNIYERDQMSDCLNKLCEYLTCCSNKKAI